MAAAMGLLAAAGSAQAVEASWSGFGTLGWARTSADTHYQRFIDRDGTLKRDSLLAGQLDLRLAPQWSATVQAKLAACQMRDDGVCARAAWAFVGWRPDDDWLLRLGKARVPMYLHSESMDIGVSHDMARLPQEVYSVAPTHDFTGLFVTRSFTLGHSEIGVDAYSGTADTAPRLWLSEGVPPQLPAGAIFFPMRVRINGLVLTSRQDALTWRVAAISARTRPQGKGLEATYPRVELAPDIGYWKVDDAMPGPDIPRSAVIRNLALTAGAEWQIGDGWRLAGEVVRMRQRDTDLGSDSRAGYLALFKRIGDVTPYVSVARQRSSDVLLDWYRKLSSASLPAVLPEAEQIVAAHRSASEMLYAFDQRSVALGASYAVSATSKLKAEWMRTRVGTTSGHFDVLAGGPASTGLKTDTLSVNLSVAF